MQGILHIVLLAKVLHEVARPDSKSYCTNTLVLAFDNIKEESAVIILIDIL